MSGDWRLGTWSPRTVESVSRVIQSERCICAIQTLLRIDNEFRRIGLVGAKRIDPDYIEGAILWSYDGRAILSEKHWDLVDQLWAYFIDGVEAVVKSETFEHYFQISRWKYGFGGLDPPAFL